MTWPPRSRCVKQALVTMHLLEALPQDDPSNPNYDTIITLNRLRDLTERDAIDEDIARLDPSNSLRNMLVKETPRRIR